MDRKELLLTYVKQSEIPVLVDFISGSDLVGAIVLPADIRSEELCGHYEMEEYVPPLWYESLVNIKKGKLLVIDKIDSISKEEQSKFGEILRYKKISTFNIPSDTLIIVTASEINSDRINDDIFSLVARI